MNTNRDYLQRRIAHLQELWDNPQKLDIPYPDQRYSWPAVSIGETEIEIIHFDIAISKALLKGPYSKNKLLFSKHQFTPNNAVVTDYIIGEEDGEHWICDYCFFDEHKGIRYPYAIGVDVEDEFNGWWVRNNRLHSQTSFEYKNKNCSPKRYWFGTIPFFFVSPTKIFSAVCLHQSFPQAEEVNSNRSFQNWLFECNNRSRNGLDERLENVRENYFRYTNEHMIPILDYLNKL